MASSYAPDTIIDRRYRILETVARGSMGTVYRAQQVNLKREVALKVLDIDARMVADGNREEHHRRFLYEAATLSRLTHPNTVRVYDFGIWKERPYLVMEFVTGSSLQHLLKAGDVDPLRAVRIARQICRSLGEAHEQGLVHRDLKPANILIGRDTKDGDLVKVVDFGLVKEMGDAVTMTGDGVLLGTPLYMSPEQIRGHQVDQRCDIYAIGVLLYQALAGRPPFKEKQTAALLMAHLNDTPKALSRPGLPENLEWTVMRCLEKDREKRFFSVHELERALKICEASLLKPELAGTMSLQLDRGHITVAAGGRSRFGWLKFILIPLVAAALAMVFAYVLVRGLSALRDSLNTPETPAFVVEPAVPLPLPAPVVPVQAPAPEDSLDENPADDDENADDAEGENADATEAEAAPEPEVEAAPSPRATQPRPRPRRRARPRPAPAPAPAPEVVEAQPVPETPAPAPTPQPLKLKVGGSDLKNPFNK